MLNQLVRGASSELTLGRVCDRCIAIFVSRHVAKGSRAEGTRAAIPISTAPAVEPARMDRKGVGPFLAGDESSFAVEDAIWVESSQDYYLCR